MTAFITSIHIMVCLFLILIVLVQQGKGSEMGASFGGAGQNMFGPRGAGNLLTKITYGCAMTFIVTSLSLAYLSAKESRQSVFKNTPVATGSVTPLPSASSTVVVSPVAVTSPAAAAATSSSETTPVKDEKKK